YYVRENETWRATSWGTYSEEVKTAANAMIALGLEVGQPVCILGFNRPEWVIFDVAAMAAGAVPAGIYTTNSPTECKYILGHSEAPIILLEDEEQWAKIAQIRADVPSLKHVVMMKGVEVDDDMVLSWDEFMAKGADAPDGELDRRMDALEMGQLATLIYTSGTTGPPKGVMLSHDNLAWTASQTVQMFSVTSSDTAVSYLPLSHIAEQTFSIHVPATAGHAVYYAESIDKLADNIREVQPTIFFAVPRVWERFHAGVVANLAESTGAKAKIANWAFDVVGKVSDMRTEGKEPSGLLAGQYALAKKLVIDKVKPRLGMTNARVLGTGAAPIAKEILQFFARLDMIIYEVYGQSEDTGPTSTNRPGKVRFGSVGPAYPGVDVTIADDGEIVVAGRNVFLGYYKEDQATAETLIDGKLHSGDLGSFDDDGFLWITGRKKDIIITAGGKNVAPAPLEGGLKSHSLISEVVVIGDRKKFLSALVTLDEEACAAFASENGITEAPHESERIQKEIEAAVEELNKDFARVEQIKKFTVLSRQLSIEGGELTPTLKVKRNKVTEHFAAEIDAMYGE
ncbi:MAG: AMP-binding protein, partial [Acidimicrobiia bacterium]|nr:AMP-binding protein [Acidimicrobiia bacterium]